MEEKTKRKWGDRKDGKLLRNIDSMHRIMPYAMPNRTDNEAVLNYDIDITALEEYLAKKNGEHPAFKYTIFHAVLAALCKTCKMRPKLNYFYQGYRLYERNNISFAFTAKRTFEDKSEEALAVMAYDQQSELPPIEQVHSRIEKFVTKVRKEDKKDGATDILDSLSKLPRWLCRFVFGIINRLEYHGWLPQSFVKEDPYHVTFFVTNLGSIKMNASYHHLANFGTNSVFVIVGEKKLRPVFAEDGSHQMRMILPLGVTIDERIADGFYFCKSLKLFKYILENPELLDRPWDEEIDFKVD